MPETALVETILLTEAIRISVNEARNAKDTAQVELILTKIGELVDQLGACAKTAEPRHRSSTTQTGNRDSDEREAVAEIVTLARKQPHTRSIAARDQPESVVLDFVHPARASRRTLGGGLEPWTR